MGRRLGQGGRTDKAQRACRSGDRGPGSQKEPEAQGVLEQREGEKGVRDGGEGAATGQGWKERLEGRGAGREG